MLLLMALQVVMRIYGIQIYDILSVTYVICVKRLFKMKYVKSLYRSALADECLQSVLKIKKTDFEPQLEKFCTLKKV